MEDNLPASYRRNQSTFGVFATAALLGMVLVNRGREFFSPHTTFR